MEIEQLCESLHGQLIKGDFRGFVKFCEGKEMFRDCFVSIDEGAVTCWEREKADRGGFGLGCSCCIGEGEIAFYCLS